MQFWLTLIHLISILYLKNNKTRGVGVFVPYSGIIYPSTNFSSFEYVSFKMEIKQSSILYITIYKPPQNCLLVILLNYFQLCALLLNVHMDVAHNKQAKELTSCLEMFGLTQHVTEPPHSRGHTLDELISKGVVITNVDVVNQCSYMRAIGSG